MAAYDYTPLYGAGDIVPGTTAGILANLGIENPNVPVFELLGSANKGGSNVNERMTFAPQPGQSYRLVNKATGEVLGEASTPEGISALVEQSNALSKQLGKKADIAFEQSNPEVFGGGYTQMFRDQPNELVGGVLGKVMDIGLPVLGAALGGPIGAGLASAASSAAQERSLKDTLLRAALTAGTAAAFPGAPTPSGATVGSNLPSWGSMVAPYATNAGTAAVANAASSAIAPAIGDIVVTAARNAAPSVLGPAVTSGIANTLLDQVINQPAQVEQPTSTSSAFPEELIVTAKDAAPVTFGNVAPVLLPSVGAALGSSIASTATPDLTQTPEKNGLLGRLTANMGITDYLTAASLLGSGVSSLLGGGGGAGTTAGPYVSPFGAGLGGAGFGAGQDMRVNPNIADYERYGFGPEASFFAPGYSQLVSGAAGAPAATTAGPASAMVNPQYVPLI